MPSRDPSVSPADTIRRLPIRKLLTNVAEPESPEERDAAWNEIERRAAVGERDKADLAQYEATLASIETILFGDSQIRSRDSLEERAQELAAAGERDRRQIARLTEALRVLADPSHWMQRRIGENREWVWIGPALGDVLVGARAVLADEENADG